MQNYEKAKKVAEALEKIRIDIDDLATAINELIDLDDMKAFNLVNDSRVSEILTELYDEFQTSGYKKLHNDLAEARYNL